MKMMRILFICLFLMFPCVNCGEGCGKSKYPDAGELDLPPPDAQIVGGIEARPHEFPWQVLLRRTFSNEHFCGGVIITESWVMTAAHCIFSIEAPSDFFVVVGEHDISANNEVRQNHSVETFIVHEKYGLPAFNNDIALVKVSPVIEFNVDVGPVCLPKPDDLYVNQKSQTSGWGRLALEKEAPNFLMYTTLNITTNEFCKKFYLTKNITENMICTIDNRNGYDRDACKGDSGGPLTVKDSDEVFSVVGIISFGEGCAFGYPGVNARVNRFLNWINDTISIE